MFSIPVAEYASFSVRLERLKLIYYSLISNFSKYYFKVATLCLLVLSWHIFTASELDSNYFSVLLWKIAKTRDHNEIESEKYSENINQSVTFFNAPKIIVALICKQSLHDNCNKVSYLQKNKKWYNLETIFQKKVNFSQ